ncbi:MAG: GGDEF domain-containing protein [Acidobacteria bacterium]|nr:GGDEF domain-containing protein [Acidobacteriota bacterium]
MFAQAGPLDPSALSIDPRTAAAFAAAIACGLLLLQYAHRRHPFILIWAGGWLLMAPAMLAVARRYPSPWMAHAAVGVAQLLGVGTAALFLWSADVYRQTRFVRRAQLRWLAGAAAWFLLAPIVLGDPAATLPGSLLAAILLAGAGAMYAAVLLERRMIGAGLIACVCFGLAISSVTAALTGLPAPWSAGRPYAMLVVNTVLYAAGALGVHLLIFEDMTYELRAANRRLEAARAELLEAAITDPLTGCHNRRFLDQVIARELQRRARFDLPLSLLFIDIDRFKLVNDTLGHDAGDQLLRDVACFLQRHIREADYLFRWGGDEFLALIACPGDEARRKAAVLKASFDAAPTAAGLPPGVGLSVGWIEVPHGTTDLMPLVREADARMYRDKADRIS